MGFYKCTFVLKPEDAIPELFEYHDMMDGWFGLIKTVLFDRERHFELRNIVWGHLGERFKPYYHILDCPKETILSKEEVDAKFADYLKENPDTYYELDEFVAAELSLSLDSDGSAYKDSIIQEENEETFEGRFDSFSIDTRRIFIDKNGNERSIIKVADLDLEKTKEAFDKSYFGFVLNENGKMIYAGEDDDPRNEGQIFLDYVKTLSPEYVLVFARLHD